jgi:hypothetical protein
MVTKEELMAREFASVGYDKGVSHYVTAGEMKRFDNKRVLGDKIYNKITEYALKHNIKNKYEGLIEICQLSDTSLKKSCAGTQRITRLFLYKFTVGLHMSVDEANEYFKLCGGELTEDCLEDYVCIKALEHGDEILVFISQFNQYVKEYDKFQTTDKLKIICY